MDATRTQLESSAQRFHYRRGFDDAMAQVHREEVFNAAIVVVMLVITFVAGWVAKKRLG